MKMNPRVSGSVLVLCLLFTVACAQQPAPPPPGPDLKAEEAAIRKASAEWAKAIAAKDMEKSISYYAADACVLPPGGPRVSDAEGRRKLWEQVFATAGLSIVVEPGDISIAKGGDLAYEIGKAVESMPDKKGKTTTISVKYLVVWKKQADGAWKAQADIWNNDN
jgi:uncharacterized protein (TIGR02246 family)